MIITDPLQGVWFRELRQPGLGRGSNKAAGWYQDTRGTQDRRGQRDGKQQTVHRRYPPGGY